jgi:hypothetical protein
VFLLAAGTSYAQEVPVPKTPADPIGQTLQLADFSVQQLDLPATSVQQFAVHVHVDGVDRVLHLRQHSLRSEDFRLLVDSGDGLVAVEPPAPRTYRGFVIGVGNSIVAASLSDGQLTASVYLDRDDVWYVEPLSGVMSDALPADHVVYHAADVLPDEEHRCGTDEVRHRVGDEEDGSGRGDRATGLEVCEIGLEADYPYYQKFYSVPNTVRDMERIFNDVGTVYERDCDLAYEVTTVVVRTSSTDDPYYGTNPESLLNQMGNVWTSELSGIRRDVAQLFTGRSLDGSVIGISWLGSICSSTYGYSLCQSKFGGSNWSKRVALHAHELGHSWNATHCDAYSDCHIMCSYINGCDGIGAPEFGWRAQGQITNYANSRPCLHDLEDPVTPPLWDQFVSTGLRNDLWSYNDGGAINTNAVNEPSAPYSLNLDSTGSDEYGDDDDIRTNFIQLEGYSGVNLSYHTQHRGVEYGEKLYVEYWNNDYTWVEINEIASNGSDQSSFDFHEHALPSDAYHDEFRVRFRVDGSSSDDDWYIDDVLVSEGEPPPPPIVHELVEVTITQAAKDDDPTLEHAQTCDLVVTINDDDWTSTCGDASIDGAFYQHPLGSSVPLTQFWPAIPALEFDCFWCTPDLTREPGFASSTEEESYLDACWFDTEYDGGGTYTIARYTVTSGTLLEVAGNTTLYSTGGFLWPYSLSADVDFSSSCEGDLDGDGDTDQGDLGILLADWGCTSGCVGDLDGDDDTDQGDLGILLADYGCVP